MLFSVWSANFSKSKEKRLISRDKIHVTGGRVGVVVRVRVRAKVRVGV